MRSRDACGSTRGEGFRKEKNNVTDFKLDVCAWRLDVGELVDSRWRDQELLRLFLRKVNQKQHCILFYGTD